MSATLGFHETTAPFSMPDHASAYDELCGKVCHRLDETLDWPGLLSSLEYPLTDAWSRFFAPLSQESAADFSQRCAHLLRQIRDNGITYNVYADTDGPQRPWSLDLFPLILSAQDWQQIEAGARQHARLLEALMADIYGPQHLLASGVLPSALVHADPGYLRTLHGTQPLAGRWLHVVALDLARGPNGHWHLVGLRTEAPSGLGYLLENRLTIASQFGTALDALNIQRLTEPYRILMSSLRALSPTGPDAHLALLTPGPYNETYFEHAYLARYLGLTLVEGNDLVVRNERLYLKTLEGLVAVDGLLKRVDDAYLDPLELRPDSSLGVPGLLQTLRAGHLLLANAPGSALLESTALREVLPSLMQQVLHETSVLPIAPPQMPYSRLPVWNPTPLLDGTGIGLQTRPVMLRVFALGDGAQGWHILPGGLARVAAAAQDDMSMQHGGSSADVWVQGCGDVERSPLRHPHLQPPSLLQRRRMVTSRAAENLFWMGRYTERTENTLRLARLTLDCLQQPDRQTPALLDWLGRMAMQHTLVLPGVPSPVSAPQGFERALIDSLASTHGATSVGFSLRALMMAASNVRERLSLEHWRIIVDAEASLITRFAAYPPPGGCPPTQALHILKELSERMAAITGAQTDRMARDDGWRLLSVGRHIERLAFLCSALQLGLRCEVLQHDAGFDAMLDLFDSAIPFHAQFQQSHDLSALVELLVNDPDNPRSMAWVAQTLRSRLSKLGQSGTRSTRALVERVPEPTEWNLFPPFDQLPTVLGACVQAAFALSEDIGTTFFNQADVANFSVGMQ